jgi:hypothetical protein
MNLWQPLFYSRKEGFTGQGEIVGFVGGEQRNRMKKK